MIAAPPLTIADIFDRTVAIVVRRWRVVVAFAAIDAVPNALIIAATRGHEQTGPAGAVTLIVAVVVGALTLSPLARLGGEPGVPDDVGVLLRRAVHDFGRSLGSFLLIYAALAVAFVVVALVVFGAAIGVRFVAGAGASPLTTVAIALVLCALMIPSFLIASVAYANVILERVSPWRGLTSAAVRVGTRELPRTWLLGAALLVVSVGPGLAVDAMLRPVATATGMWWLVLPEPFLSTVTGVAFSTVAGAVAAVDYRNRRQGADLHAVLDAVPSST